MRSCIVKENHNGSAVSEILRYRQTDKHFLLLYNEYFLLRNLVSGNLTCLILPNLTKNYILIVLLSFNNEIVFYDLVLKMDGDTLNEDMMNFVKNISSIAMIGFNYIYVILPTRLGI